MARDAVKHSCLPCVADERNVLLKMQADEEVKPAKQAAESSGTTDASKNGFLAPPASEAPSHVGGGVGGQTGMAAEAGNALTDIPSGIQADKTAVAHTDLPSAAGNTKDTGEWHR